MCQQRQIFLAPHGHKVSLQPLQNRRSTRNSSTRSSSMPNYRDDFSVDDNSPGPSILVEEWRERSGGNLSKNNPYTVESHTAAIIDHVEELSNTVLQKDTTLDPDPGDFELVKSHETENSLFDMKSRRRIDSDRTSETGTIVPRRNLSILDVTALIFNKMVGTGIFTTPGAVLMYTKSKPISLILWAVGGVFTSLFLVIYLEFGSALPFNGGELIYLDEMLPRPELLATILFSGFFILLSNSYGNSVTFAKQTILASDSSVARTTDLDSRLVRFIAIVVLSAVCLLHYSSNRFGLFLNKLFAIFKTILLFTVFVAGVKAAGKKGSGLADFYDNHGARHPTDGLAAMVLILYSYQGWENANYVAGEIRAPARTLKIGAFIAVGLVTVLYILVTLAYEYLACDYETITNQDTDLGVALLFAPKVFGSAIGLKVCMALSAVGNLIAVTFTSSKVKQAIAVQRILPFYKYFQKDINTPKGALVLHWISSVILILVCPTSADGYSFAVGLFTYGHIIVGTIVTLTLYRLPGRMRQTWPDWTPEIITNKYIFWILPIVFSGGNLIVLIWGAKPHAPGTIPRYWWPAIFYFIIWGSAIYWCAIMITQIKLKKDGEDRTVGSVVGFEVKIYNEMDELVPDHMQEAMVQSRLDGSRRRVEYKFSGVPQKIGNIFVATKNFIVDFLF